MLGPLRQLFCAEDGLLLHHPAALFPSMPRSTSVLNGQLINILSATPSRINHSN